MTDYIDRLPNCVRCGKERWAGLRHVCDFLSELRYKNILRDQEWNPTKCLSLVFRGCELGGEIGEAQNLLKKIERERLGLVGSRATIEQLTEELADSIICLDLIAMEFNINLEEAVRNKFNKTSDERKLTIRMETIT